MTDRAFDYVDRASPVSRVSEIMDASWLRGREMARKMAGSLRSWRAAQQLGAYDDMLFKDVGVSRGNVDWLVRNGRQDGR